MTRSVLIFEPDAERARKLAAHASEAGGRAEIAHVEAAAHSRALQHTSASSAYLLGPGVPVDRAVQILAQLSETVKAAPALALLEDQASAGAAMLRAGASETLPILASGDTIVAAIKRCVKLAILESDLSRMKGHGQATIRLRDLGSADEDMARAIALGERAAGVQTHVLLEGEAGAGKRLLARAIHACGDRSAAPFIEVDVAALDPTSAEHMLLDRRAGAYWQARGGNLLLKDVDRLPLGAQTRIGALMGDPERPARELIRDNPNSVRVLASASNDLLSRVKAGAFREDLFYRLNICPIWLPPLRRRREDIAGLALGFMRAFALETGQRVETLSATAINLIRRYDWPGNLIELEREIYRAVLMADGPAIEPRHFPRLQAVAGVTDAPSRDENAVAPVMERDMSVHRGSQSPALVDGMPTTALRCESQIATALGIPALTETGELRPLEAVEADMIRIALERYRGSMTEAAQRLGIGRSTLYRKIREFGLAGRSRSQ